ncbi:MAG: hypothetical protein IKR73_08925 [Oscillospiraceae bacterium]|nr:hypothetical protein [Oscillospiraceae bacterium]
MATTDVSELRKRDKRKAVILIVTVVFITAVVLIAIFTKDKWLPALKETNDQPVATGIVEEAELSEGNFPLKINSGMGYQLMTLGTDLALLDDSSFHLYNSDGKVMLEQRHTYANPILCTSKNKALIYDVGGTQFRLLGRSKQIYEKATDGVIYLARLSENDLAAVVTRSDQCLSQLDVYNDKCVVVFTYYSSDSRIMDIEFNKSGNGCIITVLDVVDGELTSRMLCYNFSADVPLWQSESVDTLAMDVRWYDNDTIAMIGDTRYALFDSTGKKLSEHVYNAPIKDYSSAGELAAVVTENTDLRRTMLAIFSPGKSPVEIKLEAEENDVYISGSSIYVLTSEYIYIYDPDGIKSARIKLRDQFGDICKSGKYIYLLGYDSVSRIEFVNS